MVKLSFVTNKSDASRSEGLRVPINYLGIQKQYSRKEDRVEIYNLLFSTLKVKNKTHMKQQELKSRNIDFSLITSFHYTHQNLSSSDSTGSYKIFLSNTIHYSSFLYRIDISSTVQSKKLSVLEPFFQQCKYPCCCLIKFFCDPFQSHKHTRKWLIFKQMSANR